jgi:hypothetical protein
VTRRALAVLALAFALAHLPFLAPSLEDIDSVNFALGVRDFDVAEHRPHPPGYPVYIGLGKAAVAVAALFGGSASQSSIEARGLSALSLVGAVAAIVMTYGVFRALAGSQPEQEIRPLAATALSASCPLFWYLGVRPMSDVPGLAAALAALWCLMLAWRRQRPDETTGERRLSADRMAASGQMIVLGALLSGVAIGFRSQNAVLTLPLLAGVLLDRTGRGVAGAIVGGAVAMTCGVLLWAVPLVVASGGVNAYLAALGSQAGEDFAGVEMLYLNPGNLRLAAVGLLRTLIFPWDSFALGAVVITLASLGALALLMRERRTFAAVALLVAPYTAFHLMFHDTSFVRYALPLVPAIAFLAVTGLEFALRRAALVATGALALWAVAIASPVVAAYAHERSPTVRALDAMHEAARRTAPAALAMHHTFRRPLQAERVELSPVLASPPRREWLELTRYWREGGTGPVWLLADPRRTDLALIDPRSRHDKTEFVWSWQSLNQLGGMRPAAVAWYRISAPGWFAEEGWALTPETAGIARLMGRGPSTGPIGAWVRRRAEALHLLVGGRHLGPPTAPSVTFVVAMDGKDVARWEASPGFFLEDFPLPGGVIDGDGVAPLTIRMISGEGGTTPAAIEQFDVQSAGALMWGYDTGWHEAEYNPLSGIWRWTSEQSTLRIINATAPVVIAMQVESPARYFERPSTVRLRAGNEVVSEATLHADTVWRVVVPLDVLQRAGGRVTVETNQTFVPADTSNVRDQRRLGLRVFGVNVAFEH